MQLQTFLWQSSHAGPLFSHCYVTLPTEFFSLLELWKHAIVITTCGTYFFKSVQNFSRSNTNKALLHYQLLNIKAPNPLKSSPFKTNASTWSQINPLHCCHRRFETELQFCKRQPVRQTTKVVRYLIFSQFILFSGLITADIFISRSFPIFNQLSSKWSASTKRPA